MPLELIDDEFEICQDCLLFDAGYSEKERGEPYSIDYPPWGLLMDPDGTLRYQWAQNYEEDNDDAEPIQFFSSSRCEACGTWLGGDRFEGHLFLQK
jgi:hypothetical protein